MATGAETENGSGEAPGIGAPGRTDGALLGIPQVGELIAGKYLVERVIGVGGMGAVVAARHQQLGHTVAIKFLLPEALRAEGALERFLREARAAVRIQSEHVVRVMDVDTLPTGAPYVVMELLTGTDLAHLVDERGPLPVAQAAYYVLQACDAIAEAHALGIVHRDLKPANLFLASRTDGSPLVKVLDFGISKAGPGTDGQEKNLTSTRAMMGSPQYMSPEQVRSAKNVDGRTDVWALGVIVHQLVAGSPPFDADTVLGVCAKIVSDPPVPLRAVRPDAPAELEALVLACLEKSPGDRLQNVGALARALQRFAPAEAAPIVERIARVVGLPGQTGPLPTVPASVAGHAGTPLPATPVTTDLQPPRRRGALVALVVGAAVVAAAGAALVVGLGRPPAPPTHAPLPAAPAAPVLAAPASAPASAPAAAIAPPPPAPRVAPAPAARPGHGSARGAAGRPAAALRPAAPAAPAASPLVTAPPAPGPTTPPPAPPPPKPKPPSKIGDGTMDY